MTEETGAFPPMAELIRSCIRITLVPPADRGAAQRKAFFESRAARGFERVRRSKIF